MQRLKKPNKMQVSAVYAIIARNPCFIERFSVVI